MVISFRLHQMPGFMWTLRRKTQIVCDWYQVLYIM